MKFLCSSLFIIVLVLAGQTLSPVAHAEEPLVIQRGSFKADGSFELSVKGPAHSTFYVEVSTDGKTYSGLTQAASSGIMVVFYTCDDKGECTAIDREAGQSPFRLYRLQVFVMTTGVIGN